MEVVSRYRYTKMGIIWEKGKEGPEIYRIFVQTRN